MLTDFYLLGQRYKGIELRKLKIENYLLFSPEYNKYE